MSISYISGRMLKDNLERDANLSIATDIVYVDIVNGRLGVKNTSPTATLSVNGNANISGNLTAGNIITDGIANVGTLIVTKNATVNGSLNVIGNITGGNLITNGIASVANISVSSTTPGSFIYANESHFLSSADNLIFDGANLVLTGSIEVDHIRIDGTEVISDTTISIKSSNNGNVALVPEGSGLVTIDTSNGILLPAGKTAERPSSNIAGVLRYNTDTNAMEIFNGRSWEAINHTPFSAITTQVITGDNLTTTFTLDNSTTSSAIIVVIGGTVQQPDVAYTVNGDQITFSEAPLSTDEVVVRFISEITTVSGISDAAGTTYFKANNANLLGIVNSSVVFQVSTNNIFDVSNAHSIQLPIYSVEEANSLPSKVTSQLIYVSNGDSGNACLAVYDGLSWRRIGLGPTISV